MPSKKLLKDFETNNAETFFKRKGIKYTKIDCTKQKCPVNGYPHMILKKGMGRTEIPGYVPWSEIRAALS